MDGHQGDGILGGVVDDALQMAFILPVLEEGRDICSLLLLPAIEHVEELDEVGAFALGEELPIA